ncbi:MAG TPA: TCP-1/cpn60 chaperonin family protein [Syntrophomonadaceae bacterium]|nr:TCP-1/cpn60 chaperonin family protein [Syntrophomonadaceae bacterium]HPR92575.1 TCP-1/cpn60 chaperonin family protein [Syntrophomonadaceae bacterium]
MGENKLADNYREDRFETLLNNASAARVIARAVEGTIGPKGLDIMMVDNFGDVIVTNDGVTILKLMDVTHPVAHMIINTARAQQAEVGDGTTTAVVIAGALISQGAEQVLKGVPVTRVISGINLGINKALEVLMKKSMPVKDFNDEVLSDIASIAGRGHLDLAELVVAGAQKLGFDRLNDKDYKFSEAVTAKEFADSKVFSGVLINRQPVNKDMPKVLTDAKILVLDDALKPDETEGQALGTEAGFGHYLQARERFAANLGKFMELGINVIAVSGTIDDMAEHILYQAGIIAVQRVSGREIERLCFHTGARRIKRNVLNSDKEILKNYIGAAEQVITDEKLEHTYILAGKGQEWVTLLIGAATEEIADERERMAKDAAAAVQASIKGGIVPGGGAVEVWIASQLETLVRNHSGMESYGILCVKEALLRPFCCMAANAGFNPLEKLGEVIEAQKKYDSPYFSFDCDSGETTDMLKAGVADPTLVKAYAFKAAGEVATAVLRINAVIKMQSGDAGFNTITQE